MIDSPSLGVVKAGQKTHRLMLREFLVVPHGPTRCRCHPSNGQHVTTDHLLQDVFSKRGFHNADARMNRAQDKPIKQRGAASPPRPRNKRCKITGKSHHHEHQGHKALICASACTKRCAHGESPSCDLEQEETPVQHNDQTPCRSPVDHQLRQGACSLTHETLSDVGSTHIGRISSSQWAGRPIKNHIEHQRQHQHNGREGLSPPSHPKAISPEHFAQDQYCHWEQSSGPEMRSLKP